MDKISSSLCYKKCLVIPNQGIEFYFDSEKTTMRKQIYFGQSLAEVLTKLGNPNKEFHKGNLLYLNYFELGVDIMIENQDFSVKKIILHSNDLVMPDFCFYDRCSFELVLTRNVEAKLPGNDVGNGAGSLQISQIHKVDELDESCSNDQYADLNSSCNLTPPKRDRKVIEEEMFVVKESNTLKNELEEHLKNLKTDVNEEVSPRQTEELMLKGLDDAAEQSSFLDGVKADEEFPPKIYTKETLLVTPDSDFEQVHEFIASSSSQQQAQEDDTQFYQRNFPNNGSFNTRFYAFPIGVIFEVIPSKGEGEHAG